MGREEVFGGTVIATAVDLVGTFRSREENLLISQRQGWLRKTAEAEEAWKLQAHEIQSGRKDSMLAVLEKRGYVNSTAGYALKMFPTSLGIAH